MKQSSVIRSLILKDLRLHRAPIATSVAVGIASLALFLVGTEVPVVIGTCVFFISLIVLGSMLPGTNLMNERKKHNLAFVMSLPISTTQYTVSKLVSPVGMYLVPWLILVAGALYAITSHPGIPDGVIPMLFVLVGLVFVGFCVMVAAAMVGETEAWTNLATILANSSYGIGWYLIVRIPAVNKDLKSPTAVWSPIMLNFLTVEFVLIAMILGLTFYLQSRKRDFI
jgi:ABC-2 type transport system permease protein